MTEIPSIQRIFARDKNKNYTKEALLYQDILRYSVKGLEPSEEYSFKLWDITDWLLSNNMELANDYKKSSKSHLSKTNKIEARIGRIRRFINSLLYLGLIDEYSFIKQSKGRAMIASYRYTEFGFLIALLIMTLSPKKRQKAIGYIHKLFCKIFANNPSSYDKFCFALTNKMVENNLFEFYIDGLTQHLEKNPSPNNLNELFNDSIIKDFSPKATEMYLQLRKEAFDGLHDDLKKCFMHKQKLEIERKMFGICHNLKGFEKMSFDLRNDYDKIVTEGYCKYCQLYLSLAYSLLEYVELAPFVDQMELTCPQCKQEKSVIVPSFPV